MSLDGNSWMILASASNPLTQQPETFVAYVCFRLSIRRWGTLASHELEVASQSHEVNIRSTDNVEALISVTLSYAIGGISVRLSVRHTHTHTVVSTQGWTCSFYRTMPCIARTMISQDVSVCLPVYHTPVFCRNGSTIKLFYCRIGTPF